ncbi:hypothetical protein ACHHYP_04089 [Achlya hypogyna]|uniref:Phosphatidylinositol-glycan biosynthesis class F protein n=1 Tax=Achlya hypogyna TaxID=1202772 RepID=A0A1V9Z2C6_ACHHY|nr:hypothetical protein ACHHYP_04089 [Achlya hypogyna]
MKAMKRVAGLSAAQALGVYVAVIGVPKWTSLGSLEEHHPDNLAVVTSIVASLMLGLHVALPLVWRTAQMSHFTVQQAIGSLGLTLASVGVIHVILIFFGAPVLDLFQRTLLLATYLAFMAVLPLTSALGLVHAHEYVETILHQRWRNHGERQGTCTFVGTLLGAYIGALLLPLDWDRPWQQWPLPCVYGAVYGQIAGLVVATGLLVAQTQVVKRHD